MCVPGDSRVKNPPASVGDVGSIPGLGRNPGEGNDNPLQYSCLGNPVDRGAWQAIVHGVKRDKSWQLNNKREEKNTFPKCFLPSLCHDFFFFFAMTYFIEENHLVVWFKEKLSKPSIKSF